jgi:hypothetical protein
LLITVISTSNIGNMSSVIVQAGYLVRNVYIDGPALHVDGDLNATVPIRVLGAPSNVRSLHFNTYKVNITVDSTTGEWTGILPYTAPKIDLPDLSTLAWKYLDNLPEIQPTYDDSLWTVANNNVSNNTNTLQTPTSLFASDYGYHTGVLIYRGHFVATGNETTLEIQTQGGSGFGSSVWLNSTYIGSWPGIDAASAQNSSHTLPNLLAGKSYIFTIVIDNNGLDENWTVGPDQMKNPRGILSYSLTGHSASSITWKLTGNLGGETYFDKTRGPLNEGGLFAERQGYHQPYPPSNAWPILSPLVGTTKAGVAFYSTSFRLDLPRNYDIPLSFTFTNTTLANGAVSNYRAQLYINGYQYGKYVNNIGPQRSFPVPQGIINHRGMNWVAVEVWAQQSEGASLGEFKLKAGMPVWTGMKEPSMVERPDYKKRVGAY